MSFLLYMASQQRAYNILQGEIPSTIDISNTFTISLDGTTLVSTFTAGTTITPQGFVDKLNSDLNLGNDLTLGEDSYVSVEKLKELYPGLEVLDVSSNLDMINSIYSIDTSFVQVNETLALINTELTSVIEYLSTKSYVAEPDPESELFNADNGAQYDSSENYVHSLEPTAYNILKDENPKTIDIINTFILSRLVNETKYISSLIQGTSLTPHGFIEKVTTELQLNSHLTLVEDTYVSVERIKELYPGLGQDVSSNSNMNSRISSLADSFIDIDVSLSYINEELDFIREYKLALQNNL